MSTNQNILSIDFEEWYHALFSQHSMLSKGQSFEERLPEVTAILISTLKKTEKKATFFVLGELVRKHPALIQQIASEGHEIGVHGYSHKRICNMSPDEFRNDLKHCKKAIYQAINLYPVSFRAPAFSINRTFIELPRI